MVASGHLGEFLVVVSNTVHQPSQFPAVSMNRLLRTYILEVDAHNTGMGYYFRLMDGRNWDTQTHMSLIGAMVGLGDILVVESNYFN